jgi:hypothetical protein
VQGADKAEVTSWLHEGEIVIVSAQSNYQVGDIVRPKFEAVTMPDEGGDQ